MIMETIFMNTETHRFVLHLLQRLDLRATINQVALQNLSGYFTWKNIRQQYKNNKLNVE